MLASALIFAFCGLFPSFVCSREKAFRLSLLKLLPDTWADPLPLSSWAESNLPRWKHHAGFDAPESARHFPVKGTDDHHTPAPREHVDWRFHLCHKTEWPAQPHGDSDA